MFANAVTYFDQTLPIVDAFRTLVVRRLPVVRAAFQQIQTLLAS